MAYGLKAGYKLVDGAYCYGNEDEVGQGLKEAFAAGVKREDVFVVTKVWATYNTRVELGLDKSLASLGLDYVDLFLVVSDGPSKGPTDRFSHPAWLGTQLADGNRPARDDNSTCRF